MFALSSTKSLIGGLVIGAVASGVFAIAPAAAQLINGAAPSIVRPVDDTSGIPAPEILRPGGQAPTGAEDEVLTPMKEQAKQK